MKHKHGHKWTDNEIEQLLDLWISDKTKEEIANEMNTTIAALNCFTKRLRKQGVPFPRRKAGHKRGISNRYWTQEDVDYLMRRRMQGISHEQIAKELDKTFLSVQSMTHKIRREGINFALRFASGQKKLWNPKLFTKEEQNNVV